MQTIELAETGRRTSRLGFGCSSIMGGMGRKQSLQTLEWAFEAGIRHFDVAPMYGYGQAEACLGEFLARHVHEATVTTKFGIPPAKHPGLMNVARTLARPLLQAIPALKARAQRAATHIAAAPAVRTLTAAEAKQSLEHSLRQLRRERIDIFLLHDATLEEVQHSDLIPVLERAKQEGHIGTYGVGTDRQHAADILQAAPEYARVVQQEWSVFHPVATDGAFHIHHRSLAHHGTRLQAFLLQQPETASRWSATIGVDLREPGKLSALMMRAALRANQAGIVLFSSKNQSHIQANAALCEPSADDTAAEALYRIVQQEATALSGENNA